MERLDAARAAFNEIRQFAFDHEAAIQTESDARIQLIDRLLIEVLGWKRESLRTEPLSAAGYIDYLLTAGGRNMVVVEAKKPGKTILSTKLSGLRYFKVGGAALHDGADGIEQAARYASAKSVGFAALTTGTVWVGFRPNRLDGVEYKEGVAAVFPDMNAIADDFASFYDMFSSEGVNQRLFNVYLDREEGTALSATDPLVSPVPSSEIYLMKKTDLARDLEQLFNEFFKTLTGDTDEELLLHCFVESPESREADRSLEKITRDLISHVQTIRSETGAELRREIEASYETKKGQMVLIVGNKGAGKSTFIDRFFKLTLHKSLREKCLVVKADLATCPVGLSGMQEWITEGLIRASEAALYDGKHPVYDELQGIFFDHYQRWSTGEYKHLYDTDIDAFKIKFGEFIADRRRDKPYDYLTSVLRRAIRQRTVVPCIIFDNADNFPADFQDAVFQFAHALFRAVPLSVVVVPITDRTIWRLSKAGALQSYSAKALYLPVPSTKSVLEKRVLFIRRKLDEGPDRSGQYFSSRGLRIRMENMPAFAACVEEAFLHTDYIGRRIAALSNHDLRRSLELSQKIITAPILKVDELITAYFAKRDVRISEMRIVQALIYGEYNKFRQDAHEYILNVFNVETECTNSPLLRLSLLRLLLDKENASKEDLGAYIAFEEISHYLEGMGVHMRAAVKCVEELIAYRLVEPYEPNESTVTPTSRLAITPSGHMHFEMAFNDSVYVEQMAQTTGIRSESTVQEIRALLHHHKMGSMEWRLIKSLFAKYCLHEDAMLMACPAHPAYDSQRRLRAEFQRWV